jgi:hypothetical protein
MREPTGDATSGRSAGGRDAPTGLAATRLVAPSLYSAAHSGLPPSATPRLCPSPADRRARLRRIGYPPEPPVFCRARITVQSARCARVLRAALRAALDYDLGAVVQAEVPRRAFVLRPPRSGPRQVREVHFYGAALVNGGAALRGLGRDPGAGAGHAGERRPEQGRLHSLRCAFASISTTWRTTVVRA